MEHILYNVQCTRARLIKNVDVMHDITIRHGLDKILFLLVGRVEK